MTKRAASDVVERVVSSSIFIFHWQRHTHQSKAGVVSTQGKRVT